MSKYEVMFNLFSKWKEKQTHESIDSYKYTAPMNKGNNFPDYEVFKGNFCADGFLSERNQAKILFICKESNASDIIEKKLSSAIIIFG